ncbi:lytic transglycosylase domain-containing protein [Parabacteroides sp. PF5-9]|uniref:lytic transglycosylase domain-containing protein n=1 Tax=Parabacteroides sp. PF5-9 TaxID=1742404 RepID=UPI0024759ACC|nr:lytic transglycosylase domain-containing protein [Parabacteroides sp. PF5-9]MDH6358782.1 membrane-bound lytic murein transglycosylase D [Parabacteroides sp. PF5-9]
MKLLNNSVFHFLTGVLCCLMAAYVYISANDAKKVMDERPVVSSMTVTPEVPTSILFCGETIDLRRYNIREGFDRELSSFTYFHSTTMLYFKRANRYFPIIEPILKANGIPDDFKYLAVIESQLDPRVTSPARAVGMWQFLEGTGRQYGLTITPTVDERCHVEKSTVAACKYLKEAYDKYGNWIDVACAYNGGMARITGELEKQKADQALDLWLVEETSRYPYRIMAIKQLFENPYKYGFIFRARDLYKLIECEEITVRSDIQDLAAFAKKYNMTYADLKRFNPWLRDRKLQTAGKTYKIKVPKEKEMYYNTPNAVVHNPAWVVR